MKVKWFKNLIIILCVFKSGDLMSQYGFGTNQPDQRSIVHIVSQDSTKGFIIPIVKSGAIAADPSIKGMLVYNLDDSCVKMCTGSDWHCLIGDNSVGITDNQNLDSIRLSGKILTAYLEDGGSASLNIQPIIDSAYVDISNNLLNDNTWLNELRDSINTDQQNLSVGAGTASTSIINIERGDSVVLREGSNIQLTESGSQITISATGDGTGTDDQNVDSLRLTGTTLTAYIENGGNASVDLQPIVDSAIANSSGADNQNLSVGSGTGSTSIIDIENGDSIIIQAGSNISLSESGNTITISAPLAGAGTDDQSLSVQAGTGTTSVIDIEDGDSVIISAGTGLSISEAGNTITLTNTVTDTDAQDLVVQSGTASNSIINITNGDSVVLIEGSNIQLTESGNSITISATGDGTGTDDQNISGSGLSGTNLTIGIENGSNQVVDLQPIVDSALANAVDTDNQTIDVLSLTGTTLNISLEDDGVATQTVNLSSLQDGTGTDDQSLSVQAGTGTTSVIDIEDGDSVIISAGTGLSISEAGNTITLTNTVTDTDAQDLVVQAGTASNSIINITNGDSVVLVEGSNIQLTESGNSITISATGDGTGTDDQNISGSGLSGTNLTIGIENGTSQVVDLSPIGGDITAVTAGTGLTGGGTTGAVTINAVGDNGLTTNADDIDLGGTLNQNTTITQDVYSMIFDLTNTGDFLVRDAGTNVFAIQDNGQNRFGGNTQWRSGSTSGTILGQFIDDAGDGRLVVYEGGAISIDLDANSASVFNQQGLNRDFRVESLDSNGMLFVDASTNRVGIGTESPSAMLDVEGKTQTTTFQMTSGATNNYVLTSDASGNGTWQNVSGLFTDSDNQDLVVQAGTASNSIINITNGDSVVLIEGSNIQLTESGNSITISATGDGTGTDDQNISGSGLSGTNLTIGIENGSNQVVDLSPIGGDITAVTAGTGLTGGGTTGAVTINAVGDNGLTTNADDIDLGGALNQATTISQGANAMIFDMTGSGDFEVRDNGATTLFVRDDGNVGIGTASPSELLHVNGVSLHEGLKVDINGNTQMYMYPNDGAGNWNQYWNSLGTATPTRTQAGVAYRQHIQSTSTSGTNGNLRWQYGGYDATAGTAITWSDALSIDRNNGYIGVGNNNASYPLDVTGTAHADAINVNGNYTLPTVDGTSGQVIQTNGSGTLTWVTPSTGTDDQNITGSGLSGTNLTIGIENGSSQVVDLSPIGGDITGVTAGDGLTGGGTTGAVTLNVVATNGLTDAANDVRLGGTLVQATQINQGAYDMTYNLNGTGDFNLVDGATIRFQVTDAGQTTVGALSGAGTRMVVADAAGVLSTQAIPANGDITSVTAGTGLIGGGTSGDVTLGIETETYDNLTVRAPGVTGEGEGSGFYQTSSATTAEAWPTNTGSWYHLMNSQHSNTANNYAMQLASPFFSQELYYRSTNNNGSQAWSTVWTSSSDGAGSGLDADLLDGISSASFLRSDASDTYSGGTLTFNNLAGQDILTSGTIQGAQIFQPTANADALLTFHVGGDYAFYFGLDGNTNDLTVGGWSMGAGNKYRVWHEGNDGAGSGLDADLLDGLQASGFIQNQTAVAQGANFRISGKGTMGTFQMTTGATNGYVLRSDASGNGSWVAVTSLGNVDNLGNHTATTTLNMNSQNQTNVNNISMTATPTYDKLRVWNSSSYTIGMNSAQSYGFLNDYAMTFTMSNTANRGWLWRDVSDAATDGAMSLTTDGRLTVKSTSHFQGNVGIGTAGPSYRLHVIGDIYANGGWLRTSGSAGWYNESYGGGWYMSDATWIRTYGNKNIYQNAGILRTDGDIQVGAGGTYASLPSGTTATVFNEGSFDKDFRIESDGSANMFFVDASTNRVGIGTAAPSQALHVNGRIRTNGINETSDHRYKKEIKDLPEGLLDKVLELRGVTYKWKKDEYPEMEFEDGTQIGVIAQEIETIFPEVVQTDENGYKSVDYSHLVPVLIEAIKEQQKEINRLKTLEKRIDRLENLMEQVNDSK